ncbi:MAG: Mur ligase family protein, partial [Actinomycetota bacterium]
MKVLVLGLGVQNIDVARVLAEQGAEVFASELGDVPSHVRELLVDVEIESGGHERARAMLDSFDLVVPSPGIPPHQGLLPEILDRGLEIRSELEVAQRMTDATIVAVTGTNGKTTVCRLAERIGRAAGIETYACGNTETPFVTAVDLHPKAGAFVVEASSFRLAFADTFHPRVAIITNLAPDHLDWHRTFEHYRASKAKITARQTDGDLFLYPSSQPELKDLAPADGPLRVAFDARSIAE